jgi:heterodisulfide reductase subunit A-like polyferredoxin
MTNNDDTLRGKPPVGATLVVGAGIAGMQAALDLAESGIKVYLLDKAPAIGGTMSMLDKTFPTNDCAMCIMSPKLVEVGRHLNIELLNCAEVESISGEPGDLTVTIRQHPRYVDLKKCTGCGDCAAACPISLPDQFNGELSTRKAIYKLYPQAIPNAFAIEKRGVAPCRDACPIHQRAQGYLALVAEGRFADAYRIILEDNPFPSICGRVCSHRCEEACNRAQVDSAVNIMGVKRFVADWAWGNSALTPTPLPLGEGRRGEGKHVAIIGAGPAGLTCARDLVCQGCKVAVFEALPVPGGMMRVGVPAHRLPHEVVEREINTILSEGIELKLNHRVEDVEALLEEYDAVFIAIGAHGGVKLPIPGNDLPDVLLATEFLRNTSLQLPISNLQSPITNKRILVLGGGNVAVDTAMTAVRLGARWVGMTCFEGRGQMPAHEWEIRDAEEEGIEIFPSRTFKEITNESGKVTGVRTVTVDFHGFVDGRPDFEEFPETEEIIPADVVIFAIGQRVESNCLKQVNHPRGRVEVDKETLATNVPGIFAGGDAVTGTAFIVDAIAAGHRAAKSIENYLRTPTSLRSIPVGPEVGTTPKSGDFGLREPIAKLSSDEVTERIATGKASNAPRAEMPKRSPSERIADFTEIASALTEEQARAEAERCLRCGVCSECNQCVYVCRANAINHSETEHLTELNVGAVILTPGLEPMPGDIRPEYGYGRYPNVVTSIQFERMLSASGPFKGVVQRPSDGAHPRKVAWIQCVGSRDCSLTPNPSPEGRGERADYCSSVCCMYTTKEAIIAKEHDPHIEPTIFYIDIRSFGKGFEPYIERGRDEHGIRYLRCMVSAVKENPVNHNLRLTYVTWDEISGKPVSHEDEFDLVVLSVGLRPTDSTRALAERLRIRLTDSGFADMDRFSPTQTSVPGVFVAGAFAEPKDIPESVIEASCAASQVSALLGTARGTLTRVPEYPPERDVSDEPERVGVFICHCGINIGGVVDVPEVVEYARTLPGVVYAEHNLYTCSQDTQMRLTERIKEQGLNRVVVASCTPRTHEPLFQDTLRGAGLNPHLFEMANIREHDSWVHKHVPESATDKAKQLVAMAVAKGRKLRSITRNKFDVNHNALVIGGGLAGMTSALSIARQGFGVFLVEREHELGGNLRHIHTGTFSGDDPQKLLKETNDAVLSEPRINVMTDAEVTSVGGYTGQYKSTVRLSDGSIAELTHGAIVLATGARGMTPTEYEYGKHPNIITQRELEERLHVTPALACGASVASERRSSSPVLVGAYRDQACEAISSSTGTAQETGDCFVAQGATRNDMPRLVVMIQCVGSRDEEHPYCSRICCTQALKNSLAIKRQSPETQVIVLYRDLRSYGFREHLYRDARKAGVVFLEYSELNKPKVIVESGTLRPGSGQVLKVDVAIQPENQTMTFNPDWLVLSAGIEPEPGNATLAQLLKVPLNADGFFLEAHVKLRPVDFAAEGIFLAGLAHSPRAIEETIAQANAAAVRAVALLARPQLESTPIVASVNPKLCAACGLCVEICPYGARRLEPGMDHAEVIEVLCQGCGACVAACPNKASQQKGFEMIQVLGMLDAAIQ